MADGTYTLPEQPVYQEAIRRLRNDDLVDAEAVINPLIEALLENIHYLYLHGQDISLADLSEALAAVITAKANSADVYTKTEVDGKISSVYKPGGSAAFADLPAADEAHLGMVYNVTDKFTATDAFLEGVGGEHPAGTNVAVVKSGEEYKYDVLAGFVDLSGYPKTDDLSAHTGDKNNPHGVTPSQIGAATSSHTHAKSQITDFPASMPASDVYAWAKQPAKPAYTASEVGAAAASHGTHVSYSTAAPKMDGTAAAGTAGTVARSDHVHPTDTSRAAASHSHSNYVPTARKVNGKALSADISLTVADVGALSTAGGTLTGPLIIGGMKLSWNAAAGCLDFEVV